MRLRQRKSEQRRRGAAAVEFALVAPLFLVITLGVSETSRLLEAQNQLATAAREGARLAGMDRTGFLGEGETTNAKITDDIKNYLTANGLAGDQASVFIVNPTDHTTTFNLDDPANNLELFEVRVELPYSSLSGVEVLPCEDWNLSDSILFRNSRATISQ